MNKKQINKLIKEYSAYNEDAFKTLEKEGIRFFKCCSCGLKYPELREGEKVGYCDNCN